MIRETRQAFGLFLALLAVVAQLTVAAAVPATMVSLASMTVLCQHDGDAGAPAPPHQPMPDCLLCVVCHGTSGPAGTIAAPPMLPPPTSSPIVRAAVLPPSTTPPLPFAAAARPRGPPIPV